MIDINHQISDIVQEYIRLFPAEYDTFRKANAVRVDNLTNKWAETKGTDFLQRHLCEMPETLFAMLKAKLDDDGWKYFDSLDGKKWFTTNFPAFKVTHAV